MHKNANLSEKAINAIEPYRKALGTPETPASYSYVMLVLIKFFEQHGKKEFLKKNRANRIARPTKSELAEIRKTTAFIKDNVR